MYGGLRICVCTEHDTPVDMVKGRFTGQLQSSQQRQNRNTGRKNVKVNQANASASAQVSPKPASTKVNPVCLECGKEVTEETKALQCDKCGHETAWKCITCLGISSELYDVLIEDEGPELKWFCDPCLHTPTACTPAKDSHDKLEEIITTMGRLMEKLCYIEKRIDDKADVKHLTDVETKVRMVETKIDSLEQEMKEMKHNVKTEETHVIDCVEKVLSVRSKEATDEEAEKAKRKTNVIVHGLPESHAAEASDREDDDLGLTASMLYEMKCDKVEVEQAVRLGRRPDVEDNADTYKPRPLKLVLKTEEQKVKVLTAARNLRLIKDGAWKDVFMHADLTMKEREVRRQLVAEMKERKQQGETDLIIVNWKIVKRATGRYESRA